MRTLKFKAKLTISFFAAVNHYRNGHPKAANKQNESKSANQEPGAWEVRDMIDGRIKQILHDDKSTISLDIPK